jgi:hypothetical protein
LKIPDKGVEEHFSSSGQGKRRSCVSRRALGGAFASKIRVVLGISAEIENINIHSLINLKEE